MDEQDQLWSAQNERQICGCALRQGQEKLIICYHILTSRTADILLASLARKKEDMLEVFLQKDSGRGE